MFFSFRSKDILKKIGFKSETLCGFCAIKKLYVALIDICLWSLYTLMHNYCYESGRFDVVANSCSGAQRPELCFFISLSLYLKYLVANGKKINLFDTLPRWTQSQTKNGKKPSFGLSLFDKLLIKDGGKANINYLLCLLILLSSAVTVFVLKWLH